MTNRVYLDVKYTGDTELGLNWAGTVEIENAYDWNGFAQRLGAQAPRWEVQDINYYRSPQIPWQD
ncbi:hypothetical protein [Lentzea sp.]|uniref:hypothetical protein n=1 Tax=Lentzea sp. TaxID=56099 RepID=UPI002C156886|nr:hypothetical protein [Lentzea sp.]HUQ55620.1 hypothetical protein [Lentzea sp.]